MGKKKSIIKPKPSNKKQHVRLKTNIPSQGTHRPTKRSSIHAAKLLGKSEDYFHILAEESPNMIFINQNGVVVYANKKCEEIMGYPVEEFTSPNFNFMSLISPSSQELIQENFRKHSMGIDVPSCEYSLITKEGETIEAIITTKIIKYNGANAILGIITDISELKRDERMLKENESRLRQVIDLVPHFIFAKNRSGEFLLANNAVAQTYGTTVDELIGKTDYDFNHQTDEVTQFIKDDNEVMDTKCPKDIAEEIITRHDGTQRYLHTKKIPFQLTETHEDAILGVSIDITGHKLAERIIHQSERKYRLLHNSMMDGYVGVTLSGKIFESNKSYQELTGYPNEELTQLTYMDLTPERWHAFEQNILETQILTRGYSDVYEKEYRKKDGTIVPVELRSLLVKDETGNNESMWAIVRDITARKRAEESLLQSERNYREIFNAASDSISLYDAMSGDVIDFNNSTLSMFGYESKDEMFEAIKSGKLSDGKLFTHEQARNRIRRVVEQCPQIFEWLMQKKNGELFWAEISLRSTRIMGEGRILAVIRNINERKQAEEALRLSEETYRTIFENTGTATILIEADTFISLTNKEFEILSGYSKEEIEGKKKWTEFVHPNNLDFMLTQHKLRRESREAALNHYEFQFIDKSNTIHDIYLTIDVISGTKKSIASLLDTTLSKRVAMEMQKSEERFRSLIQNSADIITIHDENMTIKYATPSITKSLGYTQEEIIGKNPLALTHPEDVEVIANEIKLTLDYSNPGIPTEFRIRHADGSWIYIEAVSNNQLQNPNINGIIVTSRDITEKKRTQLELEQLNERLHALAANLQRVREEESTRIAREIHDELGQLLTGIKMDLAFLEEMLDEHSAQRREEILQRTQSTLNLTDRAIQSMRKITAELRPAILDTMGLSAAIEWQLEEFQHRTGIRCAYFPHTNPVDIDGACSTAIFRILQESLSNIVRHAKANNVVITLDQSEYELILEIQDDGKGITSRDLVKEKSFGILGMQERAWLLGGSFTINERVTGGTTIHVQLPIHPNEPQE